MTNSKESIEVADRISRKRAWGLGAAAAVFLMVQAVGARPYFPTRPEASHAPVYWAVNAIGLLLLLPGWGGLFQSRRIRELVNDEISRNHSRTGVMVGFWLAMIAAMVLFTVPALQTLNVRETVYLIVTPSIGIALLTFAWLEFRAHRDA